ncbi:hypothetical protein [Paraburkholderia sp. J10-1]|nr:hypothetical protein [Paraburkholderia sp. J10-1]
MSERMLRLPRAIAMVGVMRTTIYGWVNVAIFRDLCGVVSVQ